MAGRARILQNSFTSGELSPRLGGRTDIANYASGAETVENWIVFSQGGLKTRSGTRFIARVGETDLAKKIRLIPFLFNDSQAYVIELFEGKARFFRSTAQLTVPQTNAAITNGTFTTDIAGWTPRNSGTGTAAWNAGVLQLVSGAAGNEGRANQQVSVSAPFQSNLHTIRFQVIQGTIELTVALAAGGNDHRGAPTLHSVGHHVVTFNNFGFASFNIEFEGGVSATSQVDNVAVLTDTPLELTTTSRWLNSILFEVQFDQSADIMWLTHRTEKPQKLSRSADASWSFTNYTPVNDPFLTATTFPRAVAFWKSRLWFGGTDAGPNEFWATQVDDFNNLNPGTSLDNEAINGVVAGGKINVIRSMAGIDKQLFVGTYGSEMFIRGDASGKVAPSTVNVIPATEHGVSSLRPVKAAGYLLFLQRSKRKIRQLTYDFNTDAFVAPDLLLLSEHIAEDQLVDMSYVEDPDPIVWAVSSNGELLGATILPTHKILAWHRHVTGAREHPTDGAVEAIAVIPHPDGDRDQVWLVVKREIAGVDTRFIEVLEDGAGYYGQYTLDCALHYDGAPSLLNLTLGAGYDVVGTTGVTVTASAAVFTAADVGKQIWLPGPTAAKPTATMLSAGAYTITGFTSSTVVTTTVVVPSVWTNFVTPSEAGIPWRLAVKTLTGLDHLANHVVKILVDGAAHPDRTVSAIPGTVTLDDFSAQAEVGLSFTPKIVTLRPEVAGGGTIQGLTATLSNLKVRVLDTVTLNVNDQDLPERSTEDTMDTVVPLFSGDLDVDVLGWEDRAKVTITQKTNQPATILSLVSYVHFGDE